MRRELYTAIRDALLGRGDIMHVDLWNRNVEFIEEDMPWERPAVFVEIDPIEWQSLHQGRLRANATLKLHVVTDWGNEEDSLAALDLSEDIRSTMENLEGECFHGIELLSSATNHDHEEIVENIETFSYICNI
jgi:hypothetical protein